MGTMQKTLILMVFLFLACAQAPVAQDSEWTLVWSDEFDYEGVPDPAKWDYQVGNGCPNLCGWGNNEIQSYTRDTENVRVEDGNLVITALLRGMMYSSGRITTKGKAAWQYGRIEARINLPSGNGTWPAFWMMPSEKKYGGWPSCGEIDIMEHVGSASDTLYGTVHTGAYNHLMGTQKGKKITAPDLEGTFHVYAIEWDAEKIDFFMNENLYFSFVNEKTGPEAWPFDQPFHIILNIAIGGNFGGKKGVDDTIWPQEMKVDYVRVYSNTKQD